jgi:lipoyl(octanoyl) transferase
MREIQASAAPGAHPRTTRRALQVRRLGVVSYQDALDLQAALVRQRRAGEIADQLLLLEHPHVITLGGGSDPENVLLDAAERKMAGIELFETGRGGDVTYHGPGQLVGYPILDLKPDRTDVHRYVRDLEEALILALAPFGIRGTRIPGLTGVWVNSRKVAAIGIRVSSGWITSHGFALNVDTDLTFFDAIVPCGIRSHGVTSMKRLLGHAPDPTQVRDRVVEGVCRVFGRSAVDVGPGGVAATQGTGTGSKVSSSGAANSKKSR